MFHSALKMGNSGILMYVPHVCKFSTKFTLKFSIYHVKKGHSLYGKGPSKVQINGFWNIIGAAKFENISKETLRQSNTTSLKID